MDLITVESASDASGHDPSAAARQGTPGVKLKSQWRISAKALQEFVKKGGK